MIDIKNFDPSLLSIGKTLKSLDHVNTDCESILYIVFNNVNGYIIECNSIEKNNGGKYLVFAPADTNKEVLKKYTELWDQIKNQIKRINCGEFNSIEPIDFKKYFTKIRFQ